MRRCSRLPHVVMLHVGTRLASIGTGDLLELGNLYLIVRVIVPDSESDRTEALRVT